MSDIPVELPFALQFLFLCLQTSINKLEASFSPFLWMSTGLLLSLYNALFLSQGPLTHVCLSSLQAA